MKGLIFSVVIISIISVIFVQSIRLDSRIVSGTLSERVENRAHVVTLVNSYTVFKRGSGTLISQRYVLTAANMIYGTEVYWWLVYWGSNDWYNAINSLSYTAIAHPDFNPETLENDIGLVPIRPNGTIEEIGLPPPLANVPLVNEQGDVRTFGYTNTEPFQYPDILQISLPSVIEKDICKDLLRTRGDLVQDTHFCAIDTVHNSSMCLRDEGAGFIIDIDGTKTVVGVLSFYTNMCNPNFPAAYTRVSPYVDWILSVINSEYFH